MLDCIIKVLENQIKSIETPQVAPQVTPQVKKLLSVIGDETLSAAEIMKRLNFSDRRSFGKVYLNPLWSKS